MRAVRAVRAKVARRERPLHTNKKLAQGQTCAASITIPPRPTSRSRDARRSTVSEFGFLVYRFPWGAAPEGASRPSAGSASSSGASGDPGMHGERDSSTNAIVLVSRVVTGRPAAATLPPWGRRRGPTPLPFFMTLPVSFERVESLRVLAITSIGASSRARSGTRRCTDATRKLFIDLASALFASYESQRACCACQCGIICSSRVPQCRLTEIRAGLVSREDRMAFGSRLEPR